MKVVGRRDYPCGPHYDKKGKPIVYRIRLHPIIGWTRRQCPTCGSDWLIQVRQQTITSGLIAEWVKVEPDMDLTGFDDMNESVSIETSQRKAERNVLIDNFDTNGAVTRPGRWRDQVIIGQ